jgi:CheY-like chemotaxis protein
MAIQRPQPLVVIIDSDSSIRALMSKLLEEEGYQVSTHICPPTHWNALTHLQPSLIVLDHFGPGRTAGWAFLQLLRHRRDTSAIPVVLCTGASRQIETLDTCLPALNVTVCPKPFDIERFVTIVNLALASPVGGQIVTSPGCPESLVLLPSTGRSRPSTLASTWRY